MIVNMYAVQCQRCRTTSQFTATQTNALLKARHAGWQIGDNGAPDLCPKCLKELREELTT